MLLSNRLVKIASYPFKSLSLGLLLALSACQFQPLYGDRSGALQSGQNLSMVSVSQVDTRVAQQVRNHLLFLLNGGNDSFETTYEAKIRVVSRNQQLASIQNVQDSTSGTVTVVVSYDLIDLSTGKSVANGKREAFASYDRTAQVFANERAERDAENRAARETAESLRLAIAADLSRI